MRISSTKHLFLFVLFVAIISGCGSKAPESMLPKNLSNSTDETTKLLNKKILEDSFTKSVTDDYRIGPGDLLEIKVYEAGDLSASVRVNSRGSVTYQLVGEVELGTLTVQEAEEKLQKLLEAKYVKDPHVNVFIREYRSKHVAVVGAVKNPGNYELLNRGHLLDALAQAGGLTDNAGKIIYLTRQGSGEQTQIDLNELLVKGNTQLNLPVQMGDMIFVPEAGTYYVNGTGVRKPGDFRIKDPVTVSRAVQIAGGLSPGAKASDIKLIRFHNGERQVIAVDLKAIEKGMQPDIPLQDKDVLFVAQNSIVAFFQSINLGFFFPPFTVSGAPAPR